MKDKFDKIFISNLHQYIQDGYIRESHHPSLPITIYNYTQAATFQEKWDNITLHTRGLILDDDDNPIIQGPTKFFNQSEKWSAKFDISKSIISEKLDGYYISIKLDDHYGLIISSRGSFCNKYTSAAEKLITSGIRAKLGHNIQYFCELLQNFKGDEGLIVTKHPTPKLICWAMRGEDGKEIIPTPENCPFQISPKLSFEESKKYLTQEVEGVVAYNPATEERIKIKTDWFLNLHRLISDCTPNRVWEICKSGGKVEDFDIPNEFMEQMLEWQTLLRGLVDLEYQRLLQLYDKYSIYSDKEIGLSNLDSYTKSQIFNLRKDRISTVFNKIYLYKKDDFLN